LGRRHTAAAILHEAPLRESPEKQGARPMDGTEAQINFDAPAVLRKWPSLQNQRRNEGFSPYLLLESPLDECLRVLMKKPVGTLHLYEIRRGNTAIIRKGRHLWIHRIHGSKP
jgi:hypothetical protein